MYKIVVFERYLFQRHGQLEQWVVLQAERGQHFLAGFLHQLGARVIIFIDAVAEAHQLDIGVLVLDLVHELAHFGDTPHSLDVFQHVQAGFIRAAMRRAPQAGHAGCDGGERVGARTAAEPHGRCRGILLMIGVQHKDAIERALDHWIDLVVLAGVGKHHVQEVARIAELVLGVHVGLACAVFVGHGHQRGHLGNQADGGDFTVLRVVDVGAVVVEGRQCADQAGHDGHRVRIAPEAAQEKLHLLVDHGVVGHAFGEVGLGCCIGQVAVQQQVAGLHEIALGRQLLDRIPAVEQFTFVAVNVGDGRLTRRRRQKSRVIGEHAGLCVQLADIDHIRPDIALVNRQIDARAAVTERQGGFVVS